MYKFTINDLLALTSFIYAFTFLMLYMYTEILAYVYLYFVSAIFEVWFVFKPVRFKKIRHS